MAIVSKHSGDSNDGESNKNKRNEIKKPQEVVPNLVQLPDDVLTSILALLRRWDYTAISLISPVFRRFILSPILYNARQQIGNTESVLYALMRFPYSFSIPPCWYILDKTKEPFRLKRIQKLEYVPYGSALVTIGWHVYVIGGIDEYGGILNTVFRINFRSHKIKNLQSMRMARSRAAAAVFDGKIYVIGGCRKTSSNWAEVFDVDSKVWTPLPGHFSIVCTLASQFVTSAVMENKIYFLDQRGCFTYEPRENRWDAFWGNEQTSMKKSWKQCSCVVDDVLYTLEKYYCLARVIAFDPNERYWRPVTIEGRFPMPEFLYGKAKLANCGGNLVILGCEPMRHGNDVWFIEITLERRTDGEFLGTIVKKEIVATFQDPFEIENCRALTI